MLQPLRSSAYDGQASGRRIGEGNQRRRQRGRWQDSRGRQAGVGRQTDNIEGKVQNAIGGLKRARKIAAAAARFVPYERGSHCRLVRVLFVVPLTKGRLHVHRKAVPREKAAEYREYLNASRSMVFLISYRLFYRTYRTWRSTFKCAERNSSIMERFAQFGTWRAARFWRHPRIGHWSISKTYQAALLTECVS